MRPPLRWWVRDRYDRLVNSAGEPAPMAEVDAVTAIEAGALVTVEDAAELLGVDVDKARVLLRRAPEPIRMGGSGSRASVKLWPRSVMVAWVEGRKTRGAAS